MESAGFDFAEKINWGRLSYPGFQKIIVVKMRSDTIFNSLYKRDFMKTTTRIAKAFHCKCIVLLASCANPVEFSRAKSEAKTTEQDMYGQHSSL